MTAQDDCQRWCDRSGKSRNAVIRLLRDRAMWRAIQAMPDASPGRRGCGEYWPGLCHTGRMCIGLR